MSKAKGEPCSNENSGARARPKSIEEKRRHLQGILLPSINDAMKKVVNHRDYTAHEIDRWEKQRYELKLHRLTSFMPSKDLSDVQDQMKHAVEETSNSEAQFDNLMKGTVDLSSKRKVPLSATREFAFLKACFNAVTSARNAP